MVSGGRFRRLMFFHTSHLSDRTNNTMPDNQRAPNVCSTCKSRKRACDKSLPACSFCVDRKLVCRYDLPATNRNGSRKHYPGKHFVAAQTSSPSNVSSAAEIMMRPLPSPRIQSSMPPPPLPGLYAKGETPRSIHESLYQQTQYILGLLDTTLECISHQYFQTVHRWLPILVPDHFHEMVATYREKDGIPSSDVSVLLLAMCLIVKLPDLDHATMKPPLSRKYLYTTTKSAFGQGQASCFASSPFVQATLLIATCEYACVRPRAAYVSMMTCVGMARVLGIEVHSMLTSDDGSENSEDKSENPDLGLAIAMLER